MGKKKDDDYRPKIARTAKVTGGTMKGHVHEYTANPMPDGTTIYRCIAGCGHAYVG